MNGASHRSRRSRCPACTESERARVPTSWRSGTEAAWPAPQMPGSLSAVMAVGASVADCMVRWARPPLPDCSAVKDSAGVGGAGRWRRVGRDEVAILIGVGLPGEDLLVYGASKAPAGSQLAFQEESCRDSGVLPTASSLHPVIRNALRHQGTIGVSELRVWRSKSSRVLLGWAAGAIGLSATKCEAPCRGAGARRCPCPSVFVWTAPGRCRAA